MISEAGYGIIRKYEGLRLTAYPDPATGGAPWTNGYGHTKGVKKGDTCTKEQAEQWLYEDAMEAWTGVLSVVKVKLEQWELDALTSFVFNLGIGNLKTSTLLRKLNVGDRAGAADEFLRWNKAAGKEMPGLTKRRTEERKLFLNQGDTKVGPFLIPALTSLITAVPDLIRVFGDSPQAEKNAKAADIVVQAAKVATGATNEQDLVEKIESKDPVVIEQVKQAVQSVWYEISTDSSGIGAARDFNAQFGQPDHPPFWKQPAIWVTAALLPLAYIVVLAVLGLIGVGDYTAEIKAMVIAAVISGVLGAITGFWLGTSFSSSRKTELLTK